MDGLDPLGEDWKARGDRGTAILRERAIEEAAGKMLPLDAVESLLLRVAGSACGILDGIGDRCRALGASDEIVSQVVEIVTDAKILISVAMDQSATAAAEAVEQMESDIEGRGEMVDDLRGPKERKAATRAGGKPSAGNMKTTGTVKVRRT